MRRLPHQLAHDREYQLAANGLLKGLLARVEDKPDMRGTVTGRLNTGLPNTQELPRGGSAWDRAKALARRVKQWIAGDKHE